MTPPHLDVTLPPWRRRYAWWPVRVSTCQPNAYALILWMHFYERPTWFQDGRFRIAEDEVARNPRWWDCEDPKVRAMEEIREDLHTIRQEIAALRARLDTDA